MKNGSGRRVGILGGSFDPVHLGHLIGAQDAAEQMALDKVLFMPAANSPLKPAAETLPAARRAALLKLAVAGCPGFEVSVLELERGGTSHTIDTMRALHQRFPADRFFWIVGSDQAAQLPDWREIEELAELAEFIVLDRPGAANLETRAALGLRLHRIRSHAFEISSSEVRERIARGKPVRFFLPGAVADAIEREDLYRRSRST